METSASDTLVVNINKVGKTNESIKQSQCSCVSEEEFIRKVQDLCSLYMKKLGRQKKKYAKAIVSMLRSISSELYKYFTITRE